MTTQLTIHPLVPGFEFDSRGGKFIVRIRDLGTQSHFEIVLYPKDADALFREGAAALGEHWGPGEPLYCTASQAEAVNQLGGLP